MAEEQYAKRLASLARFPLGRDEIGELRTALDTLRAETEKQASFHLNVAQHVKNDLEGPTNTLLNRQLQHKKNYQSAIEREFKLKQQQESHVARAREKYESDCMRINSYTAQATIMQGKELEKIQTKLERAQQTVGANEQDFQKFSRILQDTTAKWEQDWKEFCDRCQDIEDERMEFMKDNMWAYANVISTVCVSDDESCERVRLSLEQFEPEKDMENFVFNYGTGNGIPNPPMFINYAHPEAIPPSAQRPGHRPANFQRVTERAREFFVPPPAQEEESDPQQNTAGIGAGGGSNDVPPPNQSRPVSRASSRRVPPPTQGSAAPNGRPGTNPADPNAEPIAANEQTMLKVGDRAYPVDLTHNPQETRSGVSVNGGGAPPRVGQDDDPLARQMAELRNAASSAGSIRRNQQPEQQPQARPTHQARDSTSQLSPPPGGRGGGPPNKTDYRRSAEFVVGGPPPGGSSRPTSPNPPTAVLAMPPSTVPDQVVQNVLADYQQSFPGERKSASRPTSRAGSYSGPNPIQHQGQQSAQGRPMSSDSMAGIGAQGRSPSPQPFRPPSRAPSPMQQPGQRGVSPAAPRNNSISPAAHSAQLPPQNALSNRRNSSSMRPPAGAVGGVATPLVQANGSISGPGHTSRQSSISQRPVSPNPVGIALGRDGRVVEDELADRYARPYQPPAPAPQQQGVPRPIQQQQQQQQPPPPNGRGGSYFPPTQGPPQPPYGAPPPAPGYAQPQYAAPPPTQPIPPVPQQQQPQGYGQYPTYGQPPVQDFGRGDGPARAPSIGIGQPQQGQGGYYQNGAGQMQQYGQSYGQPQVARAPSPQPLPNQTTSPTGAYTDDGRPILFYVTALYDYQAVIDEEFDFQTNDVIAVTATPEDGWWSGELLDEARKQPGRHVFPSNFVRLL